MLDELLGCFKWYRKWTGAQWIQESAGFPAYAVWWRRVTSEDNIK